MVLFVAVAVGGLTAFLIKRALQSGDGQTGEGTPSQPGQMSPIAPPDAGADEPPAVASADAGGAAGDADGGASPAPVAAGGDPAPAADLPAQVVQAADPGTPDAGASTTVAVPADGSDQAAVARLTPEQKEDEKPEKLKRKRKSKKKKRRLKKRRKRKRRSRKRKKAKKSAGTLYVDGKLATKMGKLGPGEHIMELRDKQGKVIRRWKVQIDEKK
jgi:hypothetical protein